VRDEDEAMVRYINSQTQPNEGARVAQMDRAQGWMENSPGEGAENTGVGPYLSVSLLIPFELTTPRHAKPPPVKHLGPCLCFGN
jgi:hypothetical protein